MTKAQRALAAFADLVADPEAVAALHRATSVEGDRAVEWGDRNAQVAALVGQHLANLALTLSKREDLAGAFRGATA